MSRSRETVKEIGNKEKAVEAARQQIEKQFGIGSLMKMGDKQQMKIETIPSGSILLDDALGVGGYPKGRIIEIFGPESSGKTTLALHAIAEAQKKGGIAAFVDAEHALDPVYAGDLGVDVKISGSVSRIPENRHLKLLKAWCVREESPSSLLTQSPH